MELDAGIFERLLYPAALFARAVKKQPCLDWDESYLNPKNRIETLPPKATSWCVDGADNRGTCLFMVPRFALGMAPCRIDVYIPDQSEHGILRHVLESNRTMTESNMALAKLPLVRHICRALNLWASGWVNDTFKSTYASLPFGSRIVIENVYADVRQMDMHVVPRPEVERDMLTEQQLRCWVESDYYWPRSVNIEDLCFVKQIHSAVSIVHLRGQDRERYVLKTNVIDIKYLYHEIIALLSIERHPNIIGPPLALVLKQGRFGGKLGVCGYMQEYFAEGTLKDHVLVSSFSDRMRWVRQVCSAILHIQASPVGFYPDLKLDNVVMSRQGDQVDAVVIDLEQRGGWYGWSAPEVFHLDCCEYIASANIVNTIKQECHKLLQSVRSGWKPRTRQGRYTGPESCCSFGWLLLSEREREAAHVFMLGKFLWCLAEGVQHPSSITSEGFRDASSIVEFPAFRNTPSNLRACIIDSTAGAPEWGGRYHAVVRHRNLFHTRTQRGQVESPEAATRAIEDQARHWWAEELSAARNTLQTRMSSDTGSSTLWKDASKRPSLAKFIKLLDDTMNKLESADFGSKLEGLR